MSGSDRMMKTLDGADGAIETPGSARTVDGGQPILDVDHLDVTFSTDAGDVHAVKDVSLAVRPGEVLAIVGESG
ncbi:hypothetical protein KCW65_21465, partial [Mycobacterium tuberculosis]|nr:hypothetical protein [Mycobacterium tuberculosis]